MSIQEQKIANDRAHHTHPDVYPSADEYEGFIASTRAISERNQNPYSPLGEAVALTEQPLMLAAFRVASGTRTRDDALSVADTHHMAANGAMMTDAQIARYLDLLIEAYSTNV